MTRFDGAWRTNYAANLSNAINLIGHIGTNGDGDILLEGWARMRQTSSWLLTTTITMVLCPSEKNRPQVTGSCPRLMRPLVALSMALA